MRTTVTLDEDVAAALQAKARERGVPFKKALNDAVRDGLGGVGRPTKPYRLPSRPLGLRPSINLDKALQLAGELEDEEIVRKLTLRK